MRLFLQPGHGTRQLVTTITTITSSPKGVPKAKGHSNNYVNLLQASANMNELKHMHAHLLICGIEQNVFVGTTLVSMYGKNASVGDARLVFDEMSKRNVFTWNAMIGGYARQGHYEEALELYSRMHLAGIQADNFIFPRVLNSCAQLSALQRGKEVHDCIIKSGFESDVCVANALIDMYGKCGSLEDARQLFDKMSQRDVVSWNAAIAGYMHYGHANEGLKLFQHMQLTGMKPNSVTIATVLLACFHSAGLQLGKEIHDYVIRNGLDFEFVMGNALMDMYAKCGRVHYARQGECALKLFLQMQQAGLRPDHITFIGVLSACSHAGLVAEGCRYFDLMSRDYGITPSMEHHACMVDLLGRAGRLDEAHDFINKMPVEPNASVWGALLGACRVHGNTELGKLVAEHLFKLEPKNAGNYVLLSNIYAAAGRWDDVVKVRKMMKEEGLTKRPGCSWIKVEKIVHAFLVGDKSHPQQGKIFATLESLAEQMNKAGYVPDMNFVMHDV